MVVFVLEVLLFLFVPLDPGQEVLEVGWGKLPFEGPGGLVVAALEGGQPVLHLVKASESARSRATTARPQLSAPTTPELRARSSSSQRPSRYAVDADSNARLSPYDPADAIYTAAAMLCADDASSGTSAELQQAIFAGHHYRMYVRQVLA